MIYNIKKTKMQVKHTMRFGIENTLRARQVLMDKISKQTKTWFKKPKNKRIVENQRKILSR